MPPAQFEGEALHWVIAEMETLHNRLTHWCLFCPHPHVTSLLVRTDSWVQGHGVGIRSVIYFLRGYKAKQREINGRKLCTLSVILKVSIYSDTIGGWLELGHRSGEWSNGLSSFSGWLKCSEIRLMVVYAYTCTRIHWLTYLIWLHLSTFKTCLNKTFWKWVSARVEC